MMMRTTTKAAERNAQRRRGKRKQHNVQADTVAALGTDIWLHVCLQMQQAPHAVFRLMMTNRGIRAAFQEAPPSWWKTFFDRVWAYQARNRKHLAKGFWPFAVF